MANFSENGVRQLYVVLSKATTLDSSTPAGALAVKSNTEDVYFNYVTPNGDNGNPGIVRSDLIPKDNIDYATATKAVSRPLQKQIISFDPGINGGLPIVGQEYILRFTFYGLGIGGSENQYIKLGGAYRAKAGDTAITVMAALKSLIDKNFSREPYPYITVTDPADGTLVIEEVVQPWVRGKRQASQIVFNTQSVPVSFSGGGYPWALITDATASNTVKEGNGRLTADMEWFYIGERADQFRGAGYPDNFETKYLAQPNKEYNYIEIEYHYKGHAEDIQKSPKHITLAVPTDGTYTASDIVTDLQSAGVNFKINKV